MNPYTLLGVKPDATTKQIKKAYRLLSRKYHPDRNTGDEVAESIYKDVQTAWEVLRDPARRKVYDETGSTDAPPRDSDLMPVLNSCLAVVVQELSRKGKPANVVHVVDLMRKAATENVIDAEKKIKELNKAVTVLEEAAGRFTRGDGVEELLTAVAKKQLEAARLGIEKETRRKEVFTRAGAYLLACGYKVDKELGNRYAVNDIYARGIEFMWTPGGRVT